MRKEQLAQIFDLQKEIVEIQADIQKKEKAIEKMEKDGPVVDKVKGGFGGIEHFTIRGIPIPGYQRKINLLRANLIALSSLECRLLEKKNEIEQFIANIDDSHARRIVRLRFLEGMSWDQVACKVGGGNSEDSVRKYLDRYLEKHDN